MVVQIRHQFCCKLLYLFILFCLYHLLEQLVCLILASEDHAVDFQPLCFRKIGLLVCGTVNQHRNGQGCQTLCGVGQTLIFLFQKFFRSLVFVCFLIRCLIVFIVLLILSFGICGLVGCISIFLIFCISRKELRRKNCNWSFLP